MSDKSQTMNSSPEQAEHDHTGVLWNSQVTQMEKVHDPQIKSRNEGK